MDRSSLIAAIKAATSAPPKAVEGLPLGPVWVRPFTVADMQAQSARRMAADAATPNQAMAVSLAQCLCDADGVRLFNPESTADIDMLAALEWRHAQRILAVANGDLSETDAKKD